MKWQDFIIALAYVMFNVALLPTLMSRDKPALKTSLMTGCINIVLAVTQFSLGLMLSATGTLVNALLWLILAYQKYYQPKKPIHSSKH